MIRRLCLRAKFVALSLTIVALVYCEWLNAPPTAVIPQSAMPAHNGHDMLSAAGALLKDDNAVSDAYWDRPDDKGHVYTLSERNALIAENANALRGMRRSLSLQYWNPPVRSSVALHPEFSRFRAMVRLLQLESKVRAARHDAFGAANSCLDAIQIGVNVPHGGGIEAQLVGNLCEQIGDRSLWSVVGDLDAAKATSVARRLEAITDRRFSYRSTLLEEKWCDQACWISDFRKQSTFSRYREFVRGREAMDRFFLPIEHAVSPDTADAPPGIPASQQLNAYKFLLTHSKRQIFEANSAFIDENIAQAGLPYSVELPAIKSPRDEETPFAVPDFTSARFKDVEIRMRTGLVLCAVALRAYVARHGAYPTTIQDLVSDGLLRHSPDDPFAGAVGYPFGYRRLSPGKYLLYSVGPDGVDDGGRPVPLKHTWLTGNNYIEATDRGDWVVGVDIGGTASNTPAN